MEYLQISPYTKLLTHSRILLTLRSSEGKYHSLILFRLSSSSIDVIPRTDQNGVPSNPEKPASDYQLYAMESTCPHLGADCESPLISRLFGYLTVILGISVTRGDRGMR